MLVTLLALLATHRKTAVSAAGTAAVAAVAALGPDWLAVLPAVLTVVGVYWTPNDHNGDGRITVEDYAAAVAGLVIDRAATELADRVNAAAPTDTLHVAASVARLAGGISPTPAPVPVDVPGLGAVIDGGNHPA